MTSRSKPKLSRTLHQVKVLSLTTHNGLTLIFTYLECENADLRGQLFKRDNELNELKSTLNETLRKVNINQIKNLSRIDTPCPLSYPAKQIAPSV